MIDVSEMDLADAKELIQKRLLTHEK